MDELAGQTMRTGLGFCNATGNVWTEASESADIEQLEPTLVGAVNFRVLDSNSAPASDELEEEPKKGRRRKKNTRRAVAAAMKRCAEEELETVEGKSFKKVKKARKSLKTLHRLWIRQIQRYFYTPLERGKPIQRLLSNMLLTPLYALDANMDRNAFSNNGALNHCILSRH